MKFQVGNQLGNKNAKPIWPRIEKFTIPEPNSGCHLWLSTVDGRGYATLRMNGKTRKVMRLIYTKTKGPIPDGLVLDHLCRVRCCVNPDHLEAVTHKVNINRGALPALMRERNARGPLCPQGHDNFAYYVSKGGKQQRQCLTCKMLYHRNKRRGLRCQTVGEAGPITVLQALQRL